MLSKSAFDALVASQGANSFHLVVYWYSHAPSRADATALFTALLNGQFSMSLDRSGDFCTVAFLRADDAERIAAACPSFEWSEKTTGRVYIGDLEELVGNG
jgi:hypothetical protein